VQQTPSPDESDITDHLTNSVNVDQPTPAEETTPLERQPSRSALTTRPLGLPPTYDEEPPSS
jgi:hypothetical protein